MIIRPATEADSANILTWRNDSLTREMSINTDPVKKEDHDRWYAATLKNPARKLYIAEVDGKPVGMCRFDLDGTVAATSINLNPAARGNRYGEEMLRLAMLETATDLYTTEVKKVNIASQKTFGRAGFEVIGERGEFLLYERRATVPAFQE